jgi:hypothetical protein
VLATFVFGGETAAMGGFNSDRVADRADRVSQFKINREGLGFRMRATAMQPHYPATSAQYQDFHASALYCPRCRQAMPVRSRLLLVLPDGELHEYLCQACAMSLGTKTVKEIQNPQIYFR